MSENNNRQSGEASGAERGQTTGQFGLTVLGAILFCVGIGPSLASFLCELIVLLSWPFLWTRFVVLLLGIAILAVVPTKLLRTIPKAAIWVAVGLWFLVCAVNGWQRLSNFFFMDGMGDRATLRLMLAVFGLILMWSNGWGTWILQRLRDAGSTTAAWSRARVKMILIASIFCLWLINPHNAHETCVRASAVAEDLGAYRTAIIFTTLARDTFPSQVYCANYYMEIQAELTGRISYLERKDAGQDVEVKPDDGKRVVDESNLTPSWNAAGTTKR